jgi:hypothetical protein
MYDDNGKWPGPAYDHDEKGYRQFIPEQLNGDAGLANALVFYGLGKLSVGRNENCPAAVSANSRDVISGMYTFPRNFLGFARFELPPALR